MHRVASAAFIAAIVIPAPLLAQGTEIERGPREAWVVPSEPLAVPEDATGPVFVRRQDTSVRLDDGVEKSYQGWRMKLLNPAALQLGNLSLSWDPGSSTPTLHALRIYRDGQVIDLTDEARFEVLRREDLLEQSMLTGILTAIYTIPDLRVGDELEYEVTVAGTSQTFEDSYGLLVLSDQLTPGRYKLELSWAQGHEPRTRLTADLEGMTRRGERAIVIAADDPASIRPPQDAPPRYAWTRVLEYSDFASWSELSREFAGLYAEAATLAPDSPLRAEAARIAAAHPDAMGRARAALELAQDQVRYVYVGLNAGNLTPSSADETWQRRYGDCKGKTALLLALLAELGIEAEAVMVNLTPGADDGLDQRLPSPLLFDHVLVRASIDGESYWLDGTLPSVAPPSREPRGQFRNVLPYRAAGAELESLPWRPAELPDKMTLTLIDASAGFIEPARWTIVEVKRGIEALQLYTVFSSVPQSQFESELANNYTSNGSFEEVSDVSWRFDEPTGALILTVSGIAEMDWDEDGSNYSASLPGGGFSPPSRRTRPSTQDATVPYYAEPSFSCHVTTVTFPTGTSAQEWSFNSEFDQSIFGESYTRRFEKRDDSISMVRAFRTERLEIPASEAAADNDRIDDFDNSKANITFDPDLEDPEFLAVAELVAEDRDEAKEDERPAMRVTTQILRSSQPSLAPDKTGNVPPASDPVWTGAAAPCLAR